MATNLEYQSQMARVLVASLGIEEAGVMAHEYQWEGVARYIDWRRQHQPEEGAANANGGPN
jgi:hypothetical protein